jgi:hypothetical protein
MLEFNGVESCVNRSSKCMYQASHSFGTAPVKITQQFAELKCTPKSVLNKESAFSSGTHLYRASLETQATPKQQTAGVAAS